jgi:hypothetical protein
MLKKQEETIRYNDVIFFLGFIPLINALNYYLTYTNITFSTYTLITFLIDTLEGYVAWWCFRWVITCLDKKVPYSGGQRKRILLQLFLSSACGLVVIVILTELVNAIAKQTPVSTSFYHHDLLIFLIWFIAFNGIYVALYYVQTMRRFEILRQEEKKVRVHGFPIKDSRQNVIIPFDNVVAFYTDEDYAGVVTKDEKRYLFDSSLDKIELSLPAELFFRANRQYIIHQQTITGFTKIGNGKLSVKLSSYPYLPEEVHISRTKAPNFKGWFEVALLK